MDCKQFEKWIPQYIDGTMDYPTLKEFQAHMDTCNSCMEDLSISFLVTDGLHRLEAGDAFDLQRELNAKLSENRRKLRRNDLALEIGKYVQLIAMALLFAFVVWLLW